MKFPILVPMMTNDGIVLLQVLVLMLISTFYPLASPRCPFLVYFMLCFAAAWAISGWATILSIAQDPKSAQLSIVVILVCTVIKAQIMSHAIITTQDL